MSESVGHHDMIIEGQVQSQGEAGSSIQIVEEYSDMDGDLRNSEDVRNGQSGKSGHQANGDPAEKKVGRRGRPTKKEQLLRKSELRIKQMEAEANKPKIQGTRTMKSTIKEGHNYVSGSREIKALQEKSQRTRTMAATIKEGEDFVGNSVEQVKRGRGRPPKGRPRSKLIFEQAPKHEEVVKRGRGRPSKISKPKSISLEKQVSRQSRGRSKSSRVLKNDHSSGQKNQQENPRKRGRPSKSRNSKLRLQSSASLEKQKATTKGKTSILAYSPKAMQNDRPMQRTKDIGTKNRSVKPLVKKIKRV